VGKPAAATAGRRSGRRQAVPAGIAAKPLAALI
jgi:hypothetical protein